MENPKAAVTKIEFLKQTYDIGDVKQISTLPRKFITASEASPSGSKDCTIDFELNVPPNHHAPKAATLSHRKSTSHDFSVGNDTNPLRILRDKNFPIVRPKLKSLHQSQDEVCGVISGNRNDNTDRDSTCESPSYLLNPEYTFNEKDINLQSYTPKEIAHKDIDTTSDNPIPLPPRDRNKVLLSNPKRHVRKHPLIIPGSILQRTLSKVIQTTPTEEKIISFDTTNDEGLDDKQLQQMMQTPSNHSLQVQDVIRGGVNSNYDTSMRRNLNIHKFNESDHCYVNQDDVNVSSSLDESKNYTKEFIENNFLNTTTNSNFSNANMNDRTYENLEMFNCNNHHDNTDSASLHFESILECDINTVNEMSQDVVDGFDVDFERGCYNAGQQSNKDSYNVKDLKHIADELKLEHKRNEFLQKYPKYATPQNELADNALFNKVKETVEQSQQQQFHQQQSVAVPETGQTQTDGELKKSINYVSCEDLLEFADKKPKGRERGLESDEVRIMSKVLGVEVSCHLFLRFYYHLIIYFFLFQVLPEKCLLTLDFIDWDVHKAIKICKLQNILNTLNLPLEQCVESLQKNDWDLHTTALKLRVHK